MTLSDAILLGVIQGLTEFLPVSSSGHLVFYQNLLGLKGELIAFDVTVHLGTLCAVLAYFWKDIGCMVRDTFVFFTRCFAIRNRDVFFLEHPYALTAGLVFLTTLATGLIAVCFESLLKAFFESVLVVGIAWIVMGGLLMMSRKFQAGTRNLVQMNHQDAFLIGLAQAVAIIPGISRSGMTILAGMLCGLDRETAARYSFFAAVAIIAAAGVWEAKAGLELMASNGRVMAAGFLTSAGVGYISIMLLMKIIQKGKFFIFGIYCLIMGGIALLQGAFI